MLRLARPVALCLSPGWVGSAQPGSHRLGLALQPFQICFLFFSGLMGWREKCRMRYKKLCFGQNSRQLAGWPVGYKMLQILDLRGPSGIVLASPARLGSAQLGLAQLGLAHIGSPRGQVRLWPKPNPNPILIVLGWLSLTLLLSARFGPAHIGSAWLRFAQPLARHTKLKIWPKILYRHRDVMSRVSQKVCSSRTLA